METIRHALAQPQILAEYLFGFHVLLILAGGLAAVFCDSLVRALLGLVLTLFGVAGLYLMLNAPFLALMQLMIYVGAVTVLIFLAVMLTRGSDAGTEPRPGTLTLLLALVAGGVPAWTLGRLCLRHAPPAQGTPPEIPLDVLGRGLLDTYGLAFELISVALLAAMAGAVLLGFERRRPR